MTSFLIEYDRFSSDSAPIASEHPLELNFKIHMERDEEKLLGAVDTRRYPRAETGSGATRKTPRREDRRIVRQALVDPTVTRSMIRADVGVAIVPQTISRHLAEANLESKRPFRALPLTPEHRQLGQQWCQTRSMWNVTDWQKVVFSDESRFVLGTDDNRVRVWRRPELAVQDMWAHLPRDNIRCRINSMPDRVAACIAAGGGPTRY
ncbi:HTH_Tnp_Tc3_2 domain-containing protein [Trichonephila clavipes]|nr:HTH_Tnp_Tc3_2 domain-containing protein [Trichonephila clavipes]